MDVEESIESPAVLFRNPMQEKEKRIRSLIEQNINERVLVYLSDPQKSQSIKRRRGTRL